MKKSLIISLMVAALVCVFCAAHRGHCRCNAARRHHHHRRSPQAPKRPRAPVTLSRTRKHVDEYGIDCLVCHHKATSPRTTSRAVPFRRLPHRRFSKAAKKRAHRLLLRPSTARSPKLPAWACHKKEKKAGKKAPVSCKDCHPKK